MIAGLALIVGVLVSLVLRPTVSHVLEPYLPIAVVAALDAVFGGIRARLDGIFDAKVFVVSFVSNVVVAALIVFLGDKLGVGGQLSTAVVVVLGIRIFGNAAAIRRHVFRACQNPAMSARAKSPPAATRSRRRRVGRSGSARAKRVVEAEIPARRMSRCARAKSPPAARTAQRKRNRRARTATTLATAKTTRRKRDHPASSSRERSSRGSVMRGRRAV